MLLAPISEVGIRGKRLLDALLHRIEGLVTKELLRLATVVVVVRASKGDAGGDEGGPELDHRAKEDHKEVHDHAEEKGKLVRNGDVRGSVPSTNGEPPKEVPERDGFVIGNDEGLAAHWRALLELLSGEDVTMGHAPHMGEVHHILAVSVSARQVRRGVLKRPRQSWRRGTYPM